MRGSHHKSPFRGLAIILLCILVLLLLAIAAYPLWRTSPNITIGVTLPPSPPLPAVTPETSTAPPTQQPQPSFASTPAPFPPPVVIEFPERNIRADIFPMGKDEENRMMVPDNAKDISWYEGGASPGEKGNALLAGHDSWKKKTGTFAILPALKIGEEIRIEYADGSIHSFFVVSNDIYMLDDIPGSVMQLGGETRVTMITCDGRYIQTLGTSEARCVVVCKTSLKTSSPPFETE